MVSKGDRLFAFRGWVKRKNPPPVCFWRWVWKLWLVALAVSPLAGSAGSLNRSRNNSGGRRHGDGRRAALRLGENQIHTKMLERRVRTGQAKSEDQRI